MEKNKDFWLWSDNINIEQRGVYSCAINAANRGEEKLLKVNVHSCSPITFITIEEGEKETKKLGKENTLKLNLNFNIKKLGISVISALTMENTQPKMRKEVLYLLFRGVDFSMIDDIHTRTFNFKLKYLNVDNNALYNTAYPVFLTPADPQSIARSPKNYFIEGSIEQNLFSNVKFPLYIVNELRRPHLNLSNLSWETQ